MAPVFKMQMNKLFLTATLTAALVPTAFADKIGDPAAPLKIVLEGASAESLRRLERSTTN